MNLKAIAVAGEVAKLLAGLTSGEQKQVLLFLADMSRENGAVPEESAKDDLITYDEAAEAVGAASKASIYPLVANGRVKVHIGPGNKKMLSRKELLACGFQARPPRGPRGPNKVKVKVGAKPSPEVRIGSGNLIKIPEAAKLLNTHTSVIAAMIRRGKLQATKGPDGKRMVYRSEVAGLDFKKRNRGPSKLKSVKAVKSSEPTKARGGMPDDLMTYQEAANLTGTSLQYFYDRTSRGLSKAYPPAEGSKNKRVSRAEVMEIPYIKQKELPGIEAEEKGAELAS